MAIKYLSGNRATSTASDRAGLTTYSAKSWVELGRTTLSSSSSTIDVTGLSTADYPYLMVLGRYLNSSSGNLVINFNNDTGSNYIDRRSENFGGSVATTARTNTIFSDASGVEFFSVGNIMNESDQEKLMLNRMTDKRSGTGSGNAPDSWETTNKWANTSASISSFKATCNQSMASGTEVVVLGAKSIGTVTDKAGFWQELGTATATGSEDKLSVAVDKKYLMFEMYKIPDGDASADLQFNSDTSANYAWRISSNGSSGVGGTDQVRLVCDRGAVSSAPSFVSGFIINEASREKLVLSKAIAQETAGAGNVPQRRELVGKWDITNTAITSVDMVNPEGGSFASGSYLKVWGAD